MPGRVPFRRSCFAIASREPVRALLILAGVIMVSAGAQTAMAAPNAGREGVDARPRPRAEPLPLPPNGKALPAPENRGADDERDDAPPGPAGCPDRGQPLELIV